MMKVNKEKRPILNLKNKFFSRATRAVLHDCQNDFEANADEPYFLFSKDFLENIRNMSVQKYLVLPTVAVGSLKSLNFKTA